MTLSPPLSSYMPSFFFPLSVTFSLSLCMSNSPSLLPSLPFSSYSLSLFGGWASLVFSSAPLPWVLTPPSNSLQFGAFLDPVADKLMVCVAVVLLSMAHQGHMFDVALPTAITVPAAKP